MEIVKTVLNNELSLELLTILGTITIFLTGVKVNKWLKDQGINKYDNVVKLFFKALATKVSRPISEKDKDFVEVNKELQETLLKEHFPEKPNSSEVKTTEEEKKDANTN